MNEKILGALELVKDEYIIEAAKAIESPKKRLCPRLILAAAAILIVSLLLVGFTYLDDCFNLLTGGTITIEHLFGGGRRVTSSIGFSEYPAEVRNGRIIFTLDGSEKDITDFCSETDYYSYEETCEDGTYHVVFVGGTVDNLGFAEYTLLPDGNYNMRTEYMPLPSDDDTVDVDPDARMPIWLKNAEIAIDMHNTEKHITDSCSKTDYCGDDETGDDETTYHVVVD